MSHETEPAEAIRVTVNGKEQAIPDGTTVRGLVEHLGLPPELVAVERNGEVVPRREHAAVAVHPGDRLEIVTFVGGG